MEASFLSRVSLSNLLLIKNVIFKKMQLLLMNAYWNNHQISHQKSLCLQGPQRWRKKILTKVWAMPFELPSSNRKDKHTLNYLIVRQLHYVRFLVDKYKEIRLLSIWFRRKRFVWCHLNQKEVKYMKLSCCFIPLTHLPHQQCGNLWKSLPWEYSYEHGCSNLDSVSHCQNG